MVDIINGTEVRGDKQSYISKKERALAEKLAAKKYLTYLLKEYKQEKMH